MGSCCSKKLKVNTYSRRGYERTEEAKEESKNAEVNQVDVQIPSQHSNRNSEPDQVNYLPEGTSNFLGSTVCETSLNVSGPIMSI